MPLNPTAWFDIAGRNRSQRTFTEVKQGLDGIRKSGMGLSRALNIGAGIGSLVGFASLAKSAANLSAELLNTSDKLGLSTDFLQTWTYAADRFDISSSAASIALQRFTRRIAEANQGSGELSKVIEELNIDLRDNAGNLRPIEAILADYADAIAAAESEADQLRLSFKAFDSEGAALVSVLRQGSEGFRTMEQAARDAGYVIDKEVAQQLADAQKSLEDFQRRITIFAGNVAASVVSDDPQTRSRGALSALQSFGGGVQNILSGIPTGDGGNLGEVLEPGMQAIRILNKMAAQPDSLPPINLSKPGRLNAVDQQPFDFDRHMQVLERIDRNTRPIQDL